jgi:hypothetical protein
LGALVERVAYALDLQGGAAAESVSVARIDIESV